MGELARKFGGPKIPDTPLELLTPRPGEGFTFTDKWKWPVAGTLLGFVVMVQYNRFHFRPWYAGLHLYPLAIGGMVYGVLFIRDKKFKARIEADAVMRHYIELHPEDFPPFEAKRWGEIYQPFKPVR